MLEKSLIPSIRESIMAGSLISIQTCKNGADPERDFRVVAESEVCDE